MLESGMAIEIESNAGIPDDEWIGSVVSDLFKKPGSFETVHFLVSGKKIAEMSMGIMPTDNGICLQLENLNPVEWAEKIVEKWEGIEVFPGGIYRIHMNGFEHSESEFGY